MEPLLVISILISFFLTLFFTPFWIRGAKRSGLVGKDVHKLEKADVAESGGVGVLFGFVLGVLSYVAIKTFYFYSTENLISIFALLSSILIVGFIGLIDDILGWKIGLNKRTRILFLIFASIPLIVINAGESGIFGIDFGLVYPLLFIPIGIIATSTTFNTLAGYNGLETSQGIIILSALALVAYRTENSWISVILLCMVASMAAFYFFNKNPAKVFPGDTLTYPIGALIAITAVLGNIEKIAIFFFIPYIFEAVLKIRGKLKKESFSKLNADGSLDEPYDKIYGLEHLAVRILKKIKRERKAYEWEVVISINLFQLTIIFIGFLLFSIKLI
ncbi:glycosyl transferase family 4 [Candidatus Pacearchaeota archaeon]|nr:glycosyl transferase family 4 [Candidatus Pacearchaeota archaeon]